jgi:ATP-dependent DNA ligase
MPAERPHRERAWCKKRLRWKSSGGRLDPSQPVPYIAPSMLSRTSFIEPCLPSHAERPPLGPDWVQIKHDGYRLMARRDPVGIRLLTRNGHDWSPR